MKGQNQQSEEDMKKRNKVKKTRRSKTKHKAKWSEESIKKLRSKRSEEAKTQVNHEGYEVPYKEWGKFKIIL